MGFKVDMKWKFLFFDMKVQEKLERKPSTFLNIFPTCRDISVQRSVKWHQKWFTKIWPIVETLAKTAKFVRSTGLHVNK